MKTILNQYIESLKASKKYDDEYLALLSASLANNEDGNTTIDKIMTLINNKYAKSNENKD